MAHVPHDPVHDTSSADYGGGIAEPGALLVRREVTVTPEEVAAFEKAARRWFLAWLPRFVSRGWPFYLVPWVPHGWRFIRVVTVTGVVLATPFAYFLSSWVPLLVGVLLFPIGWTLAIILLTVVTVVVGWRTEKTGQQADSPLWLQGPVTVEVYERVLYCAMPQGQLSFSQITSVKGRGPMVRLEVAGRIANLPSGLATAEELAHLVGGPPVMWPSDGGPEVCMTQAWIDEQLRDLPHDAVGEDLRSDLVNITQEEHHPTDYYAGIVPAALRYDANTRQLVNSRFRSGGLVDDVELRARGRVAVFVMADGIFFVMPVAAIPPEQLRALIEDLGPERCDVDIVLDGERVVSRVSDR